MKYTVLKSTILFAVVGYGAAWTPLARPLGSQLISKAHPVSAANENFNRKFYPESEHNRFDELEQNSMSIEEEAADACALVVDAFGNLDEDQLKICEELSEEIKLTEEHSY